MQTANDSARGAREPASHVRLPAPSPGVLRSKPLQRGSPVRARELGSTNIQRGTKHRSRSARGRHYAGSGLRRRTEQAPPRELGPDQRGHAKTPKAMREGRGWPAAEVARGKGKAAYLRESWRSSPFCPLEHTDGTGAPKDFRSPPPPETEDAL